MKAAKTRMAAFLLIMATTIVQSIPARACSITVAPAGDYVMPFMWGVVILAWASLPMTVFLWRSRKFKARYTILPSLLMIAVAHGGAIYLQNEAYKSEQALAKCSGAVLPLSDF